MCYRMSEISRHPVVAATRALRFADHVTKRNEGSGNENEHYSKALHGAAPDRNDGVLATVKRSYVSFAIASS